MIPNFFSLLSKAYFFSNWQPLRVKGWDRALAEYTVAMLTDSTSISKDKRLGEISCPGLKNNYSLSLLNLHILETLTYYFLVLSLIYFLRSFAKVNPECDVIA